MDNRTEGSKYQETKDIWGSELVKIIKQDLRDNLPKKYKVLASKEEYAGGWSIHVTIKKTGIEKYVNNKRAAEYNELEKKVSDIVEAYNYDNSDIMSDYFSTKFYSHIRIEK
jgi:hypothetical protein